MRLEFVPSEHQLGASADARTWHDAGASRSDSLYLRAFVGAA